MVQKTRKRMNKKGGMPSQYNFWSHGIISTFLKSTGRIVDKSNKNAVNIITLFIFSKLIGFNFDTFQQFLDGYKDEIDITQNFADAYLTWKSCPPVSLLELICMDPSTYIPTDSEKEILLGNKDITNDFIKDTLVKIRAQKPDDYKNFNLEVAIDDFFGKIIRYLQEKEQYPTIFSEEQLQDLIAKATNRLPKLPGLVEYLELAKTNLKTPIEPTRESSEGIEITSVDSEPFDPYTDPRSILSNQANGYRSKPMGNKFNNISGVYWFLEPKALYGMARGERRKCNEKVCTFDVTYLNKDKKKITEIQEKRYNKDEAWYKVFSSTITRAKSPITRARSAVNEEMSIFDSFNNPPPIAVRGGKKSRKRNKKSKKNKRSKKNKI